MIHSPTASPVSGPLVVVVPCGVRKLEHPAAAGDLYTGSYHRAARRAAAALTADGGTVLIISARFGLLALDDSVAPYEQRMGRPGAVTGADVTRQVLDRGLADAQVVLLTPRTYTRVLLQAWPAATAVLAGTSGIGEQLAILAAIAAGRRSAALPSRGT